VTPSTSAKKAKGKCPYCSKRVSLNASGSPYPHKDPSTKLPCGRRDYNYAQPPTDLPKA
jgi:hypothetical protein